MVKLFNIQDTIWLDDINTVEKAVDALKKEDDGVECDLVKQVEHEVAIQVRINTMEGF